MQHWVKSLKIQGIYARKWTCGSHSNRKAASLCVQVKWCSVCDGVEYSIFTWGQWWPVPGTLDLAIPGQQSRNSDSQEAQGLSQGKVSKWDKKGVEISGRRVSLGEQKLLKTSLKARVAINSLFLPVPSDGRVYLNTPSLADIEHFHFLPLPSSLSSSFKHFWPSFPRAVHPHSCEGNEICSSAAHLKCQTTEGSFCNPL